MSIVLFSFKTLRFRNCATWGLTMWPTWCFSLSFSQTNSALPGVFCRSFSGLSLCARWHICLCWFLLSPDCKIADAGSQYSIWTMENIYFKIISKGKWTDNVRPGSERLQGLQLHCKTGRSSIFIYLILTIFTRSKKPLLKIVYKKIDAFCLSKKSVSFKSTHFIWHPCRIECHSQRRKCYCFSDVNQHRGLSAQAQS